MNKKTASTKKSATTASSTTSSASREEVFRVKSSELIEKIKEIIAEGNARQVIVEDKKGKILFTIPVTFGVIGALLAPWVIAIGAIAAITTECTIRVEK